jgi:nitrogen fixation protein FixH
LLNPFFDNSLIASDSHQGELALAFALQERAHINI